MKKSKSRVTKMTQQEDTTIQTIVMDGNLQRAEALAALSAASLAATAALPDALFKCKTKAQMQKVIAHRDTCQLAYTNCLARSLKHTGPLFEQIAQDLEKAAGEIAQKSKSLQNAIEATNLLSDAVRLASSLALAFA
jgi:hypothetical protein